jgi:hypothetical protein
MLRARRWLSELPCYLAVFEYWIISAITVLAIPACTVIVPIGDGFFKSYCLSSNIRHNLVRLNPSGWRQKIRASTNHAPTAPTTRANVDGRSVCLEHRRWQRRLMRQRGGSITLALHLEQPEHTTMHAVVPCAGHGEHSSACIEAILVPSLNGKTVTVLAKANAFRWIDDGRTEQHR